MRVSCKGLLGRFPGLHYIVEREERNSTSDQKILRRVLRRTVGERNWPFPRNADQRYRELARGVQNTSSDFTKDSISLWCSGIPTTGTLWAWIDFNFRCACSGVIGTRLGGGQGSPRGTTSPSTFRDSKGWSGVTPVGKGHAGSPWTRKV